jgi:DNA-binding MarR family transcriptional regulator
MTDSAPLGPELPAALVDHAGYLAVRLGQRAQAAFEDAIVSLDLRPAQFDFLVTLAEHGAISQRRAAEVLGVDAARIVALTDLMASRGVVTRTVDPQDRRRNLVALTRPGRTLVTKALRLSSKVEDDLLRVLDASEQETLRRLLQKTLRLPERG